MYNESGEDPLPTHMREPEKDSTYNYILRLITDKKI
jgi:hypothetical protein